MKYLIAAVLALSSVVLDAACTVEFCPDCKLELPALPKCFTVWPQGDGGITVVICPPPHDAGAPVQE